ncbi:ABC transporter permease [Fluviispira vulneris]|uniref:ABC transporter permease n=1 Tax=Fluviispira vulneris TaxID=2763012 RepID=UPI00164919DB|nr:ABC-2 family transporter protein [Fluviispira vulneris]
MKHLVANGFRYIRLISTYMRLNLLAALQYRFDFFAGLIINIISSAMIVTFYIIVFNHVNELNGWTLDHMMILTGSYLIVNSLYVGLIFHGISRLPKFILEGQLDQLLTQPISPRLQILLGEIDIGSLLSALLGIGIVIYYTFKLQIKIDVFLILNYAMAILFSQLFLYRALYFLMSLAFWLGKIDELRDCFSLLIDFGNRPKFIYPKILNFIFSWLIPIFLVANVPAEIILQKPDPYLHILSFMSLIPIYFLSEFVWRRGLKIYASANK